MLAAVFARDARRGAGEVARFDPSQTVEGSSRFSRSQNAAIMSGPLAGEARPPQCRSNLTLDASVHAKVQLCLDLYAT